MEEFKLEAIKQITEHHRPVAEVSHRLGVSSHWHGSLSEKNLGVADHVVTIAKELGVSAA